MVKFFVFHFLPYSTIFQLYDGDQFLLVEERTQMHYTMYLGRDHRPSESKLTTVLTQSNRYEQDSNLHGLEVRFLVVWDQCLNHSATEVLLKSLDSKSNVEARRSEIKLLLQEIQTWNIKALSLTIQKILQMIILFKCRSNFKFRRSKMMVPIELLNTYALAFRRYDQC
jgi:hypothetical protein